MTKLEPINVARRTVLATGFAGLLLAGCQRAQAPDGGQAAEAKAEPATARPGSPTVETIEEPSKHDPVVSNPKRHVASAAVPGGKMEPKQPASWITVQSGLWIPVIDDVGKHLYDAHQAFMDKDASKTASALRQAAKALDDKKPVSADSKKRMARVAAELRAEADRVAEGKRPTEARFDDLVVQANDADVDHAWVFSQQETLQPYSGQPAEHMQKAMTHFERESMQDAANEIRQAAAFVKLFAVRADLAGRKAMRQSADALSKLATQVEQDQINDAERLNADFSKVEGQLATLHTTRGMQDLDEGRFAAAGRELQGAAMYLDGRAERAGDKLRGRADAVVAAARQVAQELMEGGQAMKGKAERSFESIRTELERLDAAKPSASTSSPPSEARGQAASSP